MDLNEMLEEQVAQRTAMLKLLQDVTRAANEARTVEEAMRAALRRIAQYNGWQVGHVWRKANDASKHLVCSGIWFVSEEVAALGERLQEFQALCQTKRYRPGEGIVGRVLSTGHSQWVDNVAGLEERLPAAASALGLHACIAFPVTAHGEVVAALEFYADHPARREERFLEIMPDVGIQLGHVIERKRLEREIADAREAEQRRVASDIHDGVGQELTGLRYLTRTHAETLRRLDSPEAQLAQRIAEGLEIVQKQMRCIIRDLVPVELDEKGLVAALHVLQERTAATHQVRCTFDCQQPVAIDDNLLATHLYRIAQEAVVNAVRHANARSIVIRFGGDTRRVLLEVIDDGSGIDGGSLKSEGFGLRSMAYRADLIGAQLHVGKGAEGGTVVRCTIPRKVTRLTRGAFADGGEHRERLGRRPPGDDRG